MTTAPRKKRPTGKNSLTLEALEPRVLFSADVLPVPVNDSTSIDVQVSDHSLDLSGWTTLPEPDRLELVFVDRSTPDYQSLVADLRANTESGARYQVEFIERDENGIGKISEVLSKLDGVAAVHVISHGSNGVVQLGALSLDASNVLDHAAEINAWRSALSVDADLLFYGCDLAYDAGGEFLLSKIADLSGADVAASQDSTGATALGGDWDFESEIGVIETELPFTSAVVDGYTGLLSITDVTEVNSGVEMNTSGGNSGYLFASVPLDPLAITDALTVEVRFLSDDNLTASPLISHVSSGQEFEVVVLADGTLSIGVNGQVAISSAMNYLSLSDGDVHSIAMSWSATNGDWNVYVDGVLTDSATGLAAGHAINLTGTTVLGQTQTSALAGFDSNEVFSGVLHDVRIFNELRSPSEIALNHSHKFDVAATPDSLIANWQMYGLAANGAVTELIDTTGQRDMTTGSATGAGYVTDQVVDDLRIPEYSVIGSVVGHVSPVMESAIVDLVSDGSFTDHGFAPASHTEVFAGQTFGGWSVTSGGVEVDTGRDFDPSPLGGSAVDLNGTVSTTPGIIEQQLATVAGQKYQLVFAMSGSGTGGEAIKNLRINIPGGSTFFDYEVDPAWSGNNLMWQHRSMEFTATGPVTNLQIESLEPDFWGPLIGDIRVVAIPDYTVDVLATDPDLTYDAITDKFYKSVVTTTESWLDAQANAVSTLLNGKSGQLMTIHSAYENDIGQEFAESVGTSIWIGSSDSDVEGSWFWDKGDEPDDQFWQGGTSGAVVGNSYQNWASNDPNLNEDYGIMNVQGTWHDGPGNVPAYSYLIEWRGEDIVTPYTYSLTNDAGGLFAINSLTGEISVASAALDYEQASVQTVSVKVTNAVGAEYIHDVPIAVLDVNDSPVLKYNIDTKVTDLGAVPITRSQLTTADVDHPASDIVYTITTAALHGRIALDTAPWAPISTFTQQDIDDEKLIYVHTGGGPVDSFDFTVTDGEFGVTDTFKLTIAQPEALELSSGVELNLDDGNDVYLQSATLGGPVLDATTVELIFAAQNTTDSTPLFAIDDGTAQILTIGINNITGELEFSVGGSAIQQSATGNYSSLLLDGTPHSLALSWGANGEWTIYVDGSRTDGGSGLSIGASIDLSASHVLLGEPYNADSYFSGNFYDVRIWDYSRTAEEIGHLHDRKIEADTSLVFNSPMDGLNPTQNPIVDLVSGNPLSIKHASGAQFVASEAINDLNVNENSPAGTSVGYLIPHESEPTRFVQTDGNFTDAGTPAGSQTFSAGQSFGGWQVTGGAVDQLLSDGVFSDQTLLGGNAVRLTDASASIGQTLATEAGRLYQLNYSVAGDFSSASTPIEVNAIAGNQSDDVTITNGSGWSLSNNLMWQHRSMLFAANSAATQLQFDALTANSIIADVMVVEISHEVAGVLASQRDMTYDAITQKFYKTLNNKTTISGANNTSVNQTVYGVSSRLVTVHSAYENARVHSLIKDLDKGTWLGADDVDVEGEWKWNLGAGESKPFWSGNQNGMPVDGAYSNWKPNLEPNNYQHSSPVEGEHYAVMDLSGQWNDEPFTTGLNYAIFEWDVNDVVDAFQFSAASGSGFDIDANTGEVTVASGTVLDHETTPSIGTTFTVNDLDNQTGTYTASIIVNDVNEAPTGTDFTVTANEDSSAYFNDSLFVFSDVEQHGLYSIFIDSLPQGGDLKLNNTLVAVGQEILKADLGALIYTPLADANGVMYDDFTFTIRDDGGVKRGGQDASAGSNTVTIDVTAINDEPSGADTTLTTDENTAVVLDRSDFGFTDPKDNHGLDSVLIAAINGPATVYHGTTSVSAGQWILAADIDAGLLSVLPDLHVNGNSLITLEFRVRDDGGLLSGGIDADQLANDITINVTPVNHPPDGTDKTIVVQENTVIALGQSDFGFNDGLEGDQLDEVRIDTLPSQGTLLFDGTPILPGHIVTPSEMDNNRLEYAPGNFQSGSNIRFDFTVSDDGGTANGGSDSDAVPNTIYFTVQDVNVSPSGTDKTVQTIEDSFYQFAIADFGFSDADSHNFSAVEITSLPQPGILELSGNPVSTGQTINSADISNLRYNPIPDANGTTSLDFKVIDSGGTSNGGSNTDPTANTITINISSVNDAPEGTDSTLNIYEDAAHIFNALDFGFTDTDGNTFTSVEIVTVPLNGNLALSGNAVQAGDIVPASGIGNLSFTPQLNAFGNAYDSLTFKVIDDGGTTSNGIDKDIAANQITFNVLQVNDAPDGTDSVIAVSEYSTHNLSAADFGFTDVEPDNFATVTLNTLPATGVLLLNGSPVAAGQTINAGALSGLQYQVASNNGNASESFDFQVQDTGGTANGGIDTDPAENTITFTIANVNLAPSGTNKTVLISEDSQHTFSAADFGFTDPDLNAFASVEIDTLPGAGVLSLSGNNVSAGQVVMFSDLASLEFTPATDASGTGYASLNFKVRDDGGTANGGADVDTTANVITIDVLSVNDAPSGADSTIGVDEYTNHNFTSADFGFTDVESDSFATVKITSLPGVGLLQLNGATVSAGQTINAGQLSNLQYQLNSNGGNTSTSFDFQVQDTGGVTNGGLDTDLTVNTITFTLANVNLAPTGTDATLQISEDTPYIFSAADFGYVDVDMDAFASVEISTLPSAGALLLSGSNVTAGQNIAVGDLMNLVFVPVTDANGAGYASFSFKVHDDGGVANGGSDTDSTANVITIDVLSVNDAPSGEDSTIGVDEYTNYNFTSADFGFTDVESDSFATVKITSLPSVGVLQLNGVSVAIGQTINAGQISSLQYSLNSNGGNTSSSFNFQVQDTGGTVNGGVDTDPVANTITFNLIDRNLPPEGTDTTININEDLSYTFSPSDFGFSDPDQDNFMAVELTAIPLNGVLLLNGSSVNTGQIVLAGQIGNLQFTPAPNAHGNSYDSISFKVKDDGGSANNGSDIDVTANTITLNVLSVNDEPAGADSTIIINEDTDYIFSAADFGFADVVDQNNFAGVTIDTYPGTGTLVFNSAPLTPGQFVPAANIGGLVYTPALNASGIGIDVFTFLVIDDGGTANGGSDTAALPNTITIDVVEVNNPPSGTDAVVQTIEDTSYQFGPADFGFTDPESNGFASLTVASLPQSGLLTLSGNTVAQNQVINAGDLVNLEFTPDANQSGSGYANFSFIVRDNGGVANGGSDTDPTSNTIVVSVLPVNDAPSGINSSVTLNEDTFRAFKLSDFGFTDIDQDNLDAIQIVSLPVNGDLTLGGSAIAVGQTVPVALITDLRFDPPPNAYGSGYESFGFKVVDDGGVLNGGLDTDSGVASINIDVLSVNDEPSGADSAIIISETSGHVFSATDFGFTDTDADSLKSVIVQGLPTSGLLTLSGTAVVQNQVIDFADLFNLEFHAPTGGGSTALIDFQVQDSGGTNNGGVDTDQSPNTITIQILNVNVAPEGTDQVLTVPEDNSYQFDINDFGFTDTDQNNFSFVEIVTTPSSGMFTLAGNVVASGQSVSVQDIPNLVYIPTPDTGGQSYATLAFKVKDDGGTGNGGVDTDQIANVLTFDVPAVNDAPSGSDGVVVMNEDESYFFSSSDFGFSDPEQHSFATVTFNTVPLKGVFELDGVAVVAGQSVLAGRISELSYTAAANEFGTSYEQFTFVVQDAGGTLFGGIDTDPVPKVLGITVNPVNDSPTGQNQQRAISEDTDYVFSLSDFGYTDIENHQLLAVMIEVLPSIGNLSLSGTSVAAGDLVLAADIDAGSLVFSPQANANGQTVLEFQVVDTGGVALNGVDTDPTARLFFIDINSVNDLPEGGDASVPLAEDNDYIFSVSDFGYTDPVDNDPMASVIIDTVPAHGALYLSGSSVVSGQTIDVADLSSGQLVYKPAANNHSDSSFSFRVTDTAAGTSSSANVFEFVLTSVNDAPSGGDSAVSLDEGTVHVFQSSDFDFTDTADNNSFAGIIVSELPYAGQVTLDGQAVSIGEFISISDIDSGGLQYHAADESLLASVWFGFAVRDDGGAATGTDVDSTANYVTFDIQSINDSPELIINSAMLDEGSNITVTAAELFAIDTDDNADNLYFTIVENTNHGVLFLEGAALTTGDTFTLADVVNDNVRYHHDGSETSADAVRISLADGGEDGAQPVQGVLTFNITEVLDPPPETVDDNVSVSAAENTLINVLDNDQSGLADSSEFVISIEVPPNFGQVILNDDGTFTYIPDAADTSDGLVESSDSFSYRVTNSDGAFSIATVNVNLDVPDIGEALPEYVDTGYFDSAANPNVATASEQGSEDLQESNEIDVEQIADEESADDSQTIEEESLLDAPRATSSTIRAVSDNTRLEVSQVEELRLLSTERLSLAEGLEEIKIRKHNSFETTELVVESIQSGLNSFQVVFDVPVPELRDVVENKTFQRALGQVGDQLEQADLDQNNRIALGEDAALGVSISVSAGALAWMLRGGSLLASMVAATPIWSSMDPLRVMPSANREESDADEGEVEQIFK